MANRFGKRPVLAAMAAVGFAWSLAANAQVLINEIVTDPKLDWNDSAGGDGVPFNDIPGTGTVTDTDEWIELLNVSADVVGLTSWTLEMIDTTPTSEVLGQGSAHLVFSQGSSLDQLLPGGRVVVGNPAGSINDNCYVVLRNALGQIVDAVEFGTADFAGDGIENNAPDGNSFNIFTEAVARIPDGRDMGDPSRDFRHIRATIGAPNPDLLERPVMRINEVVTDPQHDWNDSDGGNGVAFDDIPGSGPVTETDEWIELVNASPITGSIAYWSLVMYDTTPATETLGAGNAVFVFERGGSLDSVSPWEHVVIGNPAGSMNNHVWIRLLDDRGIVVDEVELGNRDFKGNGVGDEAPDGDAHGIGDEAVMRIPDGADTDNDAADFFKQPATIGRANAWSRVPLWPLYR